MAMFFEWDEEKEEANLKKHLIGFDEGKSIFGDPLSITIDDPEHSTAEQRFIDIGRAATGKLLVVVYTERGSNIRIISCRKATPAERRIYEEQIK
ncbi:MAG: BrnT family toxin [Anaerolineales bacterium]|nr:BrnT family toxin [Anaerolineales bacterium]